MFCIQVGGTISPLPSSSHCIDLPVSSIFMVLIQYVLLLPHRQTFCSSLVLVYVFLTQPLFYFCCSCMRFEQLLDQDDGHSQEPKSRYGVSCCQKFVSGLWHDAFQQAM
jgi:hypothetical protein